MKIILLLVACLSFFQCTNSASHEDPSEATLVEEGKLLADTAEALTIDTLTSLPEIPLRAPSKEELHLFQGLVDVDEIRSGQVSESAAFRDFRRAFLDELLNLKDIEGASVYAESSSKKFLFHDFYYRKAALADNFEHIVKTLQQERTSKYSNDYYDFFKRGIVILLDKKHAKISIVEFNIFVNPEFVYQVEDFFETNKNRFDAVIMVLGNPRQHKMHFKS